MKRHLRSANEWIEHRTGIQTLVRQFLYEEIPASSGWHQVFGSVAMFLFMVQAFTGILLAFNYAPTPGDAYNSLRYILTRPAARAARPMDGELRAGGCATFRRARYHVRRLPIFRCFAFANAPAA